MIEGKVKEEGIGEVIVESERRINQRLVREAIERWDREGEGYFSDYVRRKIGIGWLWIVRAN